MLATMMMTTAAPKPKSFRQAIISLAGKRALGRQRETRINEKERLRLQR
jgi:hypothetical protein